MRLCTQPREAIGWSPACGGEKEMRPTVSSLRPLRMLTSHLARSGVLSLDGVPIRDVCDDLIESRARCVSLPQCFARDASEDAGVLDARYTAAAAQLGPERPWRNGIFRPLSSSGLEVLGAPWAIVGEPPAVLMRNR